MAIIFGRNKLFAKTLHALTKTKHGEALAGIFPGAELQFLRKDGELVKLIYQPVP